MESAMPRDLYRHLLNSLFTLASVVEARDPYTGGHLWRVSQFAQLIAAELGCSTRLQAKIGLGGFLHDLGKIGIPDALLNYPGQATTDDYHIIHTHPEVGHHLLRDHPLAGLVADAVRSHHERPDGQGYPDGLAGEAIPLPARGVAVADAFDAMTSTRPYRMALSIEHALERIEGGLGGQFDTEAGRVLLGLRTTGRLERIVGHSEARIPLLTCPHCGPTIVMTRGHAPGDLLHCRVCGAECRLQPTQGTYRVEPTGRRGHPRELLPDADPFRIESLVETAASMLAGGPAH